jgi:hypothetical protein
MKKQILPIVIALLSISTGAMAQSYEMNVYSNQGVTTYKADNVSKVTFTQAATVADYIPTGTDLAAYINGNAIFDSLTNVTFPLELGGTYTQSAPIVIPNGVKVSILGNNSNVKFSGDAGFVTTNGLILDGVNIDASASTKPFISLNATPDESTLNLLGGAGGYYIIASPIEILNSKITGVTAQLIYDNKVKYCAANVVISNSIINFATATAGTVAISFPGGFIKDLTVQKSTLYQNGAADLGYFVQYSNSGRIDRAGYDKSTNTESISYLNNTMYSIAKSGKLGNYGAMKGQSYSIWNMIDNIFVDCSNGAVARYFLDGRTQQKTATFKNNTYWFNGAAETGNTDYDTGTQLTTDPSFKDAANADFTPAGADQLANKTGDPRWLPTE